MLFESEFAEQETSLECCFLPKVYTNNLIRTICLHEQGGSTKSRCCGVPIAQFEIGDIFSGPFIVKEKVIVCVVLAGEQPIPFVLHGVTRNVNQVLFMFFEIVVEVAFEDMLLLDD